MRSLSQLRRAAALEVLRIDAAGLLVAGTRDQLVDALRLRPQDVARDVLAALPDAPA